MGTITITDDRDLSIYAEDIKKRINRAVTAAAFKIRDNARAAFIRDYPSTYKNPNSGALTKFAEGIQIGRVFNGYTKVHALGNKEFYDSYKTRWFVGGTKHRYAKTKNGKKAYRGRLAATDSIEVGTAGAQQILEQYISNVING